MSTVGYKKLPLLLTSIPKVLEIIEPMVLMASLFFFCTGYLPTVYCILRTIGKSKHCNYIIFGITILVQDTLAYVFMFHSGHPPLIAFALSLAGVVFCVFVPFYFKKLDWEKLDIIKK